MELAQFASQLTPLAPFPEGSVCIMQSPQGSPAKLVSGSRTVTYTLLPAQHNNNNTIAVKPLKPGGTKRAHNDDTSGNQKKRSRGVAPNGQCYQKPLTPSVSRRNERERNRVKQVNLGFETLRQHVPNGANNKKMSKVDTLRSAVDYIKHLQTLLEDSDVMNSSLSGDNAWSMMESAQEALNNLQELSRMSPSLSTESAASPGGYSTDGSRSPANGSASSLVTEEEDLLDFSSWFQ